MACSPSDVSVKDPNTLPPIPLPGFGVPFALGTNNLPMQTGPEDLLEILNKLQLLVPPGAIKPALNLNFAKDTFDGIMKLLDQFFPFLMLYKFFLPLLNMIICIIEVLCSIANPFKLISSLKRLFRECIPAFLNMFPIFAIIVMLISLILLIIALVEYIIDQITKFVNALLRNINNLAKAYKDKDNNAVLSIANKLGSLLCIFQNLFVLLSVFSIIIQVIKDILSLSFAIPPCDDNNSDGCCTTDVCPDIVRTEFQRNTATLQYLNQVSVLTTLTLPPSYGGSFNFDVRPESIQLYDIQQEQIQQFRNIFDAYDITTTPKPIFFPTDAVYTSQTSASQAAYTIDVRMFYNPISWNRTGNARYIKFSNCVVLKVPSENLLTYDNSLQPIHNAVVLLAGGLGYEDDGSILYGYDTDGVTQLTTQASINNFIHKEASLSENPVLQVTDGYLFNNVEYVFKPNLNTLLNKNLVTTGCIPSLSITKGFINNAFAGDIALKIGMTQGLINNTGREDIISGQTSGNLFPDPAKTQQEIANALDTLRSNMTTAGVNAFQTAALASLGQLTSDCKYALGSLVGIGFEPCKSTFTATPKVQFTSKPIQVKVILNERNGLPIASGLPVDVASSLATKIKAYITLGEVSNFSYDGTDGFLADITSTDPGKGELMISYDNNIFCTNNIPADLEVDPSRDLQVINYQFIYTPSSVASIGQDGQVRRDEGDVSRINSNSGKDGV